MKQLILALTFIQQMITAQAAALIKKENIVLAQDEDFKPYWEYGMGFGYVHYEQYPSSNQLSNFLLPFPTFQYRGKIIRASDRDGARAYLLKGPNWSLELSGAFYPSVNSNENDARRGMPDIPWMIALGPKYVYNFNDHLTLSAGLFQATTTDLRKTELTGELFESVIRYQWHREHTFGRISFKLRGGTQDFLSTYFDVKPNQATLNRTTYHSHGGLLNNELAYFQYFKRGKITFYFGVANENYSLSSNRKSPLHKSDNNIIYLSGLTYSLGESSKEAIPESETTGIIQK
ncbi:MAG: MipA/OmpV family protein [Bdellovibrionales bacterium]